MNQKVDGEYQHLKVRLRSYQVDFLPEAEHFIETKYKEYDATHKLRLRFPRSKLGMIQDPEKWMWDSAFRKKMPALLQESLLQRPLLPVKAVYYEREVFSGYLEYTDLRITFDTHIIGCPPFHSPRLDGRPLLPQGAFALLNLNTLQKARFLIFCGQSCVPLERKHLVILSMRLLCK